MFPVERITFELLGKKILQIMFLKVEKILRKIVLERCVLTKKKCILTSGKYVFTAR